MVLLLLVVFEPPEPVRFNRDIRPIVAEHCFACHGPDPGGRKADLRLDRQEGWFGQRKDGAVVTAGKPDASPLWRRVSSKDPEEVMPPPSAHKPLKPAQAELIRRWIAEGAAWEPHWSFIAPVRPPLPKVKNERWVRTPVDRFILAALEARGLAPSPEADRRLLARRLWLDLTGLPPEPEALEAYVADRAPDATEKLVDRLLASPRYGEHRTRPWLDAARYADTHGLHFDNYREIWAYRDWVIGAFNRNLPFDRFTVEQLAGDLLPQATPEQRVATGFHRCNMTTNEGGTIAEENLAFYAKDRVETTSWVWLGLTANCAVCHDHKFDPITQEDFYSMSAFFRNTTQGALDGNVKDTAPVVSIPRPEDEARWKAIPGELEALNAAAKEQKGRQRGAFDAWAAKATPADWEAEVEAIGKPALHLATGALDWDGGAEAGDFDKDASYSVGLRVTLPANFSGSGSLLARMDNDDDYRGWDVWVQEREFAAHLIHKWKPDAIKVVTTGNALKPGTPQHVMVTYDGSGKGEGFRIYVDGRSVGLTFEANGLKNTTRTKTPLVLGRRKKAQGVPAGTVLEDVRIYPRKLEAGEAARVAHLPLARALLAKPAAERPAAELDLLFAARAAGEPEAVKADARRAELEAEKKAIRGRASVAHVMEERAGTMPEAFILFRGEYDKKRAKVGAAVFSALNPLPAGAPRNRLGLAQWITAPENPLTARVTVNRLWQELFGTGLVRTAEDFGIMGEAPSHPELLDWLAVEFREGGWDVKKLMRQLVLSAAYRQTAAATADRLAKDPGNRLLSRGPRFRMDAEMIRDSALSAAGLLSPAIGGPSVKPYQPDGVWESVAMPESNTRFYKPDAGDGVYRRSLYTFWKRHAPPASMEILNAPAREFSCLRRERTNTPLQALVTLNDPQYIEAARALAQLALAAPDPADLAMRRVLARPPSTEEAAVLQRQIGRLREHYKAHAADAAALLAVGQTKPDPKLDPAELAAWTMLCNQILNLDEALNK